jgi:hypothetical protein
VSVRRKALSRPSGVIRLPNHGLESRTFRRMLLAACCWRMRAAATAVGEGLPCVHVTRQTWVHACIVQCSYAWCCSSKQCNPGSLGQSVLSLWSGTNCRKHSCVGRQHTHVLFVNRQHMNRQLPWVVAQPKHCVWPIGIATERKLCCRLALEVCMTFRVWTCSYPGVERFELAGS